MAKRLTDLGIQELSLVFANYKGKEWAPRNEEALVLAVKGGEKKSSWFERAMLTLKALGGQSEECKLSQEDSDLCVLLAQTFKAMKKATKLDDADAKVASISAILEDFRESYPVEKAGARHNEADRQSLQLLKDAHANMGDALRSLGFGEDELEPGDEAQEPADDDANPEVKAEEVAIEQEHALCDVENDIHSVSCKAAKEPKPYGDVEYADPENGKYPIDTKEHAKAAWSYINQEKNAAEYSSDKLAEVKARIKAACNKFGIEISDEKAAEVEMTPEQVQAMIAEALAAKEAEKAAEIAAVRAEAQAQVAAANAQAEANATKAAELERVGIEAARKASASSGDKPAQTGERTIKARPALLAAVKAQLGANPESTRF